MRVSSFSLRTAIVCVGLGAMTALGGCDTVQETLGMGKAPPDEYAVAPRRPLAMPPDYDLKPPQPGAPAPADISASGIAAQAITTSGTGAAAGTLEASPKLPPPTQPTDVPRGDPKDPANRGQGGGSNPNGAPGGY